jgi:hypothetical protein
MGMLPVPAADGVRMDRMTRDVGLS